ATEDPIAVGEDALMTNYSYPEWGNELYYVWDFKDGSTDTTQNPIHSFSSQGVYHVTLYGIQDTIRPFCRDSATFTINVSGFLSQQSNNKTKISVLPNPVSNIIKVSSDEMIQKIEIYDLTGKLVHSETLSDSQNTYSINMESFVSGQYLLRIRSKSNENQFSIIRE